MQMKLANVPETIQWAVDMILASMNSNIDRVKVDDTTIFCHSVEIYFTKIEKGIRLLRGSGMKMKLKILLSMQIGILLSARG